MNDNNNLLTVERAIADNLDPASLRMVADSNDVEARRKGRNEIRLRKQAQNLRRIAGKMELLGYGRERRVA